MKPSLRKQVTDRDRACRGCGSTPREVHHIKFRSQGGRDELGNLVWLCNGCHRAAHGTAGHKKISGWELSLVLQLNVSTVTVLRKRELDRVCGGCEYRTERNECMVWDHDVDWDYTCDVWKRRNRRMYEKR